MKTFFKSKDGGPESNVTGYWLIECKEAFSIVLLRFDKGTRDAYHNHAFHAVSWILKGELLEDSIHPKLKQVALLPSIYPIITTREKLHRVTGIAKATWVISFRGPWLDRWNEYFNSGLKTTLTNGRHIVAREQIT
jgi:hypothetical protein